MSNNPTKNPVVKKIRESAAKEDDVKTLSTGIRVRIHGISSFEIQEMALALDDPEPPRVHDPESDRVIENRDDPEYVRELDRLNFKRGMLVLDATLIGVELVDGLPDDKQWLPMLQFKAKKGMIGLSDYDLDNPLEKEYVFKKYYAFKSASDWQLLQDKIAEIQGATAKADAMFPSDTQRNGDSEASLEEGSAW